MAKPTHRDALLRAGLATMFRKGYIGASVRDIAAAAGAPQGSFTNHFRSKEEFAGEVLDAYFAHARTLMQQALDDPTISARERLARYLDLVTERLVADEFARGCLIGDLSVEAPGHSTELREQLRAIYDEWTGLFAGWIAQAQDAGEISTAFAPQALADFLITGWEGAIMRMKVEQSRDPLDRFREIAFRTVFAPG